MSDAHYKWPADGSGAILQQHSVAKLEVLREYLVAYFQTLVTRPGQEEVRLTLVDGFAGGGVYLHEDTRKRILGSPFVFLEASKQAQDIINATRQKPVRFLISYIFVEKNKNAIASLRATLNAEGYGARIGEDIYVVCDTFDAQCDTVITAIKERSPNAGRSVISLDQYGYKDVPTWLIKKLLTQLNRTEILLTFAVDSLINFVGDNEATQKILNGIGMPDVFKDRSVEDIKGNESNFRFFIQSSLYQNLVQECGARYYTVFFIKTRGHGDYWLVHLSQHPRARDVMTKVHWDKNNHFVHYGGAGLNMFQALGYSTKKDDDFLGQGALFEFDDRANHASVTLLTEQLVRVVHEQEVVPFGELYASTCNTTPADSQRYRLAVEQLIQHGEVVVTAPTGAQRQKASTIKNDDIIRMADQRTFNF